MPKFIVNLFCIHVTSGMKHRVDMESELDKRWLESKMCNSTVNTISEIFIKSTKFLGLREIRKVLCKAPPSPLLHHFGAKVTFHLLLLSHPLYCFLFLLKKCSSTVLEPLYFESFCSLVYDFNAATLVLSSFFAALMLQRNHYRKNFLSKREFALHKSQWTMIAIH